MHFDVSQESLYTEIYRKNAAPKSQPRTQTNTLREPAQSKCMPTFHKHHFIRTFTRKMPRPIVSPKCRHTLCASLRSQNAGQHFTRATLYGNLQEKCRAPDPGTTLCAQAKCMSTFQKSHLCRKLQASCRAPQPRTTLHKSHFIQTFHKSHFIQKFKAKLPHHSVSPERRHTLCASLRSRNACQHFTRATAYGNLKESCRRPE